MLLSLLQLQSLVNLFCEFFKVLVPSLTDINANILAENSMEKLFDKSHIL